MNHTTPGLPPLVSHPCRHSDLSSSPQNVLFRFSDLKKDSSQHPPCDLLDSVLFCSGLDITPSWGPEPPSYPRLRPFRSFSDVSTGRLCCPGPDYPSCPRPPLPLRGVSVLTDLDDCLPHPHSFYLRGLYSGPSPRTRLPTRHLRECLCPSAFVSPNHLPNPHKSDFWGSASTGQQSTCPIDTAIFPSCGPLVPRRAGRIVVVVLLWSDCCVVVVLSSRRCGRIVVVLLWLHCCRCIVVTALYCCSLIVVTLWSHCCCIVVVSLLPLYCRRCIVVTTLLSLHCCDRIVVVL